jgi:DHA1 family multidrug resistance protein-like MFS transporter
MDNVDRFISRAEADAEPERFSPHNTHRTASADHSLSSEKISDTLSTGSEEVRTRSNGVQGSGLHQTELDRITTHGLLHSSTVGSTYRQRTRRSSEIKERLGAGKLLPTSTFHVEDFLVEFDGPEDSLHAYNWPLKKK